jgi:quercetin dioxygenase-like cupin family protein
MMEARTAAQAYARTPQTESSVWYIGSLFTFLAEARDTDGQFAVMDITTWQGGEPPRHIHHREDEMFYILDGAVTFYIGDQVYDATNGTLVFAPRGIPHSFALQTPTARMLAAYTPAGAEQHFRDARFSTPAPALTLPPRPAGPPDVGAFVADLATYSIEVVGPPGPPMQH